MSFRTGLFISAFLTFLPVAAFAEEPLVVAAYQSLADLSLEQLMEIPVTTASKREERSFETAAAIYVVTAEDIKRSGATSIPEALRLVPGLDVFRVDQNNYNIAIRGNGDLLATDRTLVLMDGRTLNSSTFSSVIWPAIAYPMEDIEKIEVVRGPGSSLWGGNAMNGVINIVTKNAHATEGGLVSAGGGNKERTFGTVRFGDRVDDLFSWRGYAMYGQLDGAMGVRHEYDPEPEVSRPWMNRKDIWQAGGRADREEAGHRTSFIANVFDIAAFSEGTSFLSYNETSLPHFINQDSYSGQNILLRDQHEVNDDLTLTLQGYWNRTLSQRIFFHEEANTLDGEAQADYRLTAANTLSAGINYRFTRVNFRNSPAMQAPGGNLNFYSFFLQDELRFANERFRITPGIKVERNQYTGWEPQPSIRLAWVETDWMSWVSAARTVRLSNTVNNHTNWVLQQWVAGDGLPAVARLQGSGGIPPEEMLSYEGGVRFKSANRFSLDLTAYLHRYTNIADYGFDESQAFLESAPVPHYVVPGQFENVFEGDIHGAEVSADYKPATWIRLFASYAYTRMAIRPKGDKNTPDLAESALWINTSIPLYKARGGVFIDLPHRTAFDVTVYHVDRAEDFAYPPTTRLDVRISWRPTDRLELEAVGRNLLKDHIREWQSTDALYENAWVMRDFYLKATYWF